jgi:sugar phosphate isomerase/epimerase
VFVTVQEEERNLKGLLKVRAGVAIAATGALLSCAATAQAQRPPHLGAGSPWGQTGIQLYDFNNYLSNGAGEITCPAPPAPATPNCVGPPAPTTQSGRLERVFAWLQSKNIKNVELYGYPGNPFPNATAGNTGNLAGLDALHLLGNQYGLRFPGRHGNLTEANWDNQIVASKIVGQDHIGEAGLPGPGFNTYANTLATAQVMNRLGKRSVEAGLGPAYFHNHQQEFNTRWTDNGVLKSAWEIIMERTDPRYVAAQIDIGWAVCGLAYTTAPTADPAAAQADLLRIINKFQSRIVSFHVKDMVNIRPTCGNDDQREIGTGDVDFGTLFAAAKNRTKFYLMERDPIGIGGPTNFNPFTNTENSLKSMRGDAAPVLYAPAPAFASVAAGTPAANNSVPVVVTNDGDAPLTITNATLAANAEDGGNQTRDDFQIVSQNCFGAGSSALQPAKAAVPDDPGTPANEAQPAVPAGTCTVNVGFRPSRTNYTSVARLQFTSNSDDAVERTLLAAKSTGDAITTVGGDVPSLLNLQIQSTVGSFGTFQPTIARNYETALAAVVTTTTGDAALSVSDASATAPGHLVNVSPSGTFSLPSPLNARAINTTNPTQAFAPLAETTGTPTTLLSYPGPVNANVVTLGFRQAIGAGDVLRSGSYSKTLTFTLSTTMP